VIVAQLNFQHHYMSHDPSEIILRCWFTHYYQCIDHKVKICFFFSRILWIEKSKEQHSFVMEIFF